MVPDPLGELAAAFWTGELSVEEYLRLVEERVNSEMPVSGG